MAELIRIQKRSSGEFPVDGPPEDPISCYLLESPVDIARGCYGCPALRKDSIMLDLDIEPNDSKVHKPQMRLWEEKWVYLSRTAKEQILQEHERRAGAGLDGTCAHIGSIATCWRSSALSEA